MNIITLLVCYFCYSVSILQSATVAGNSDACVTLNNTAGECIEIHKCPSLFSISQQNPPSLVDGYILVLSACGDERESKVCCDNDEDDVEFKDTTSSSVGLKFLGSPRSNTQDCTTPEGKRGKCIPTKDCAPLLNLLKTGPYTSEKRDHFKQLGCGFQGTDPKVCCSEETPQEQIVEIPQGPINTDLLPGTDTCGIMYFDKITGGEVVDFGELPWMALLAYKTESGTEFNCGGSLINNRYVITAAHCIKDSLISVRLGEHTIGTTKDCDICPDSIDIEIKGVIKHENYADNDIHDIALLRLAQEVAFTDFITPICIPTTVDLLSKTYEGFNNMTVAGWGITENGTASNVLRKVKVPMKKVTDCESKYPFKLKYLPGVICAGGEKGKDSCQGDSGGPLMISHQINMYIVGIVSYGIDMCGLPHWPGVYTKIAHYVPWIVSKLKP